jgi:hypothetical protein
MRNNGEVCFSYEYASEPWIPGMCRFLLIMSTLLKSWSKNILRFEQKFSSLILELTVIELASANHIFV